MDATVGTWLANRSFRGLFRAHVDVLLRLAAAIPVGGRNYGRRDVVGGLATFTPDRHADFYAALISASGAMAAILPADFLIRAPRLALVRIAHMRPLPNSRRTVA